MPLGKYHCDYCDKQFQDTPSARKRHLQGLQHQRAKALWYDSFRGSSLSLSLSLSLLFRQTLIFCLVANETTESPILTTERA